MHSNFVTYKISNNDVNIVEVYNSFYLILMIIGIGLYRLGIGFVSSLRWLHHGRRPRQLQMVTWSTIMRHNDHFGQLNAGMMEVWVVFFLSFFPIFLVLGCLFHLCLCFVCLICSFIPIQLWIFKKIL
jgi:hypothetical protein